VTLTLYLVIRHTVVHHSSTSTNTPNFVESEKLFWTDGRTFEPHIDVIRSTLRSRPKNYCNLSYQTKNIQTQSSTRRQAERNVRCKVFRRQARRILCPWPGSISLRPSSAQEVDV